jgi:branched-chain amino acid transport system permease protein
MELSMITGLLIGGILRGGMYVLMAMGLSLVFGVMRVPNFAHGEFYMIGAYFSFFATAIWKLPPLLCFAVAALGGFLIGAIIGKIVFEPLHNRSKQDWILNSFLVTAGLCFVLQNSAQALLGVDFKGVVQLFKGSLPFAGLNVSYDRLIGFATAMVVVAVFWLFLKKTKTGNAITAVSEHETGAMLMGIDIKFIHILTFSLSCMLAAFAGAALISINPAYPTMGVQPLAKSWLVVILVGLGNIESTLVGGLLVGLIETFASYYFGTIWQDVICLSIVVAILVFKPSGLFGKAQKV